MKKAYLLGAMVCALLVSSCTKPKDECTLTNSYRTEWGHNNSIALNILHGKNAVYVDPPLMYHYGAVDDLCSIEKAPNSGWHDGIRLEEGHGYIIRHTDDDGTNYYCRFILKEWIHDTVAKGIDNDNNGADTTIVGIHLLFDNEWNGK